MIKYISLIFFTLIFFTACGIHSKEPSVLNIYIDVNGVWVSLTSSFSSSVSYRSVTSPDFHGYIIESDNEAVFIFYSNENGNYVFNYEITKGNVEKFVVHFNNKRSVFEINEQKGVFMFSNNDEIISGSLNPGPPAKLGP